jgi:tRNA dimethylallyltransferase
MLGKKRRKTDNYPITVVVGPTCTGKTSWALEMCKRSGGQIISADSRQIYKGMDLGTGKMPINSQTNIVRRKNRWMVDGVSVWGYDLVKPDSYFSAVNFVQFAVSKINELVKKDIPIFLVGGTGFYVDLMTGKMQISASGPDFELRKELESKSLEELQMQLRSLDVAAFQKIDSKNPVRVARGIEKIISTSTPAKIYFPKNVKYDYVGFTAKNDHLFKKADRWLDSIWGERLFSEVKSLQKSYPKSLKLKGLIYKSVVSYLQGNLDSSAALQRAKFDTHAYIRRQLTWFRKNPDIFWIDIEKSRK